MPDIEGESMDSVREKLRHLSESLSDLKECTRDIERRLRDLETEDMHTIRKDIYELESHIASFRARNDDNKEKWKIALNFLVQLVWVIMASYVLAKLGLGTGPI